MPNTRADQDLSGSIFVLGTGRSGTTIFYQMFACHPDLGWYSNYHNRLPRIPQLSAVSRVLELTGHGKPRTGWRWLLPGPHEALRVPRYVTRGLFVRRHMLGDEEINSEVVRRYREYAASVLRWHGKSRLIHKHTGFARTSFLKAVDPTGQFIHMLRDGRAVVNSLLNVGWWDGTLSSWWWGPMPEKYAEEFERSRRDPLVLAALVWLRLTECIEAETSKLPPGSIMTLRYDQFVQAPYEMLARACAYVELEFSAKFQSRLKPFKVHNADQTWRRQLSSNQIEDLNRLLGERLVAYGFEV